MTDEVQRFIGRGSRKGHGIAVFTSGGDSQGIFAYIVTATNCVNISLVNENKHSIDNNKMTLYQV